MEIKRNRDAQRASDGAILFAPKRCKTVYEAFCEETARLYRALGPPAQESVIDQYVAWLQVHDPEAHRAAQADIERGDTACGTRLLDQALAHRISADWHALLANDQHVRQTPRDQDSESVEIIAQQLANDVLLDYLIDWAKREEKRLFEGDDTSKQECKCSIQGFEASSPEEAYLQSLLPSSLGLDTARLWLQEGN
jgi:hypothetical protein